ncbi:MAG: hypothetical protein IJW67_01330 [Blautia sp.]|nr:hypothetical protein [Blautia sp.]
MITPYNPRRWNDSNTAGVITVFFTLLITVFLALFFALAESVRIQGARAQAANAMDMANYSLFSEFEKQLLTDYELFGLDCTYGEGNFSMSRVQEHLKTYLGWNETPARSLAGDLFFDPWRIRLQSSKITGYALLSDSGGYGFYQQAVAFMKETAVTNAVGELQDHYAEALKAEKQEEAYREAKAASDAAVEAAEGSAKEVIKDAKKNGIRLKRPKGIVNPLREIARVIRQGAFRSVLGDRELSSASVPGFLLASHRLLHIGTMRLPGEHGGLTDDLLFREYLLDHFPNYLEEAQEVEGASGNMLQYQTEYLVAGKTSDVKNMKSVVSKLVWLRVGANYLYCVGDFQMNSEAEGLALVLMGWTGIAQLVEALKQGLLIGWAYAESLLDVRALVSGGRVPLVKNEHTWQCSLDQLKNLSSLLKEPGKDRGEGLRYKDYLRLLLNLQGTGQLERRGKDLIELNLRRRCGFDRFRIDHCIVAVRDTAKWGMEPVFFRVTQAFSGVMGQLWETDTQAAFAYR